MVGATALGSTVGAQRYCHGKAPHDAVEGLSVTTNKTDKTGAPTTVTVGHQMYTIAVDDKAVGHADYADRGDQRVFYHTVIDPEFGGRGLATILLEEALNAARADGKRIVPVCSMVGTVLKKHPEFDDVTDPVTNEIQHWVRTQPAS
jgi:predicted GNAT family acetyltransferase